MAELLSYQHATNTIRSMYESQGFVLADGVPGCNMESELGVDVKDAPFAALYAYLDEYLALLRCHSIYFLTTDHNENPSAITFYRLNIRLMRTLASIRTLCSYGLDGNARLQLRLLYEIALLWVRFRVDPNILVEYTACTTPKSSNEFWHKYLKGGKTENYLRDRMQAGELNFLGGMEEQIDDLKEKLSLVAHPTFLADYNETKLDWEKSQPESFVLTKPLESSYFTLSKSIFVTAMPFTIMPDPPYNFGLKTAPLEKESSSKLIPHATDSWEEYNQQIRTMFPTLFLMAIRFFEAFDS